MKRFLLLMICLMCCLTLTACYQDNDPWPASDSLSAQPTVSVTAAPTQEPQAPAAYVTPMPAAEPVVQIVPESAVTLAPQETAQPERTPGGDANPGING